MVLSKIAPLSPPPPLLHGIFAYVQLLHFNLISFYRGTFEKYQAR